MARISAAFWLLGYSVASPVILERGCGRVLDYFLRYRPQLTGAGRLLGLLKQKKLENEKGSRGFILVFDST